MKLSFLVCVSKLDEIRGCFCRHHDGIGIIAPHCGNLRIFLPLVFLREIEFRIKGSKKIDYFDNFKALNFNIGQCWKFSRLKFTENSKSRPPKLLNCHFSEDWNLRKLILRQTWIAEKFLTFYAVHCPIVEARKSNWK